MLKKILALAIALMSAAALVAANSLVSNNLGWTVGQNVALTQTKVKAKDLSLVCPGSVFATGGKSGTNVNAFSRIGQAIVDYSSNLPSGVTLKTSPLTGPAADTSNTVGNISTSSSLAVTLKDQLGEAQQGSSVLTAQSYEVASSDGINGVIGTNCQNPATDSWLIGGVTTVGREALLILANPASTDATVDLQLFGESGLIDGAGLNGISVSANRTVVLPLAAYAPEQKSLAVHVISSGAALASWIQERTVRGTVSAGADLVSPSIPAATNLVIPGLLKRGTDDASALIGNNADYADLTPSIQVFVPGSQAATVTVQVIGVGTKSTGTVLEQQVEGQSAASFDITGLKDGDYSVFVVANQPVQAAVKLSRTKKGSKPITDFAWLQAVAPLSSTVVATAANSAVSKVSIANDGVTAATVTVTDLTKGGSQKVVVPHLGNATVSVANGDVFAVSSDNPVASTLIADFAGSLAAIPMQDYKNSGGSLEILVR
jgi:hypothetical protein